MSYEIKFTEQGDYEPTSEMIIIHNRTEIARYSDGGEPEDSYFFRDWDWIESALKKAYRLGTQDASKTEPETKQKG